MTIAEHLRGMVLSATDCEDIAADRRCTGDIHAVHATLASVLHRLSALEHPACPDVTLQPHEHRAEFAADTKPGSGLYMERCGCGATREVDYRGLVGENVEPKRSAWRLQLVEGSKSYPLGRLLHARVGSLEDPPWGDLDPEVRALFQDAAVDLYERGRAAAKADK